MGMMRDSSNRGRIKEQMGRDNSSMDCKQPAGPKKTGPADAGMSISHSSKGVKTAKMPPLED